MDLMTVSMVLKRKFILNVQSGSSVAGVRQKCLDAIRNMFPNERHVYIFWLDSDMIITDPSKISDFIKEAEKTNVSFTANYHAIDYSTGRIWNTLWKNESEPYTNKELEAAKPLELKVHNSGLAICYIRMPLDYKFRTESQKGEDYLFFKDNADLDLRYAPIPNYHIKTVFI